MTEYTLKGGAIVRVAPLTYINKHRYTTLLRLCVNNVDEIARRLGLESTLDKASIEAIIYDMVKVSSFCQTDDVISGWLLDYTSDLDTLISGLGDFLDALATPQTSQTFEEMVGFVNSYLREQEAKAPTPPTDPNL